MPVTELPFSSCFVSAGGASGTLDLPPAFRINVAEEYVDGLACDPRDVSPAAVPGFPALPPTAVPGLCSLPPAAAPPIRALLLHALEPAPDAPDARPARCDMSPKQALAFAARLLEKPPAPALPGCGTADIQPPAAVFAPPGPVAPPCAGKSEPDPARASAYAEPSPESPPKPPAVHELTLRIATDKPHHNVEVRVVERGGEIHVAVRAADPALVQNLRQNLPALASGLEAAGYRGEFRIPGSPEMEERRRRESPRPRPPVVRRTGEPKWRPPFSL